MVLRHAAVLLLLTTAAARAQPADCAAMPPSSANVPLKLDLNGLPGVPSGVSGSVYADVPSAPPGGSTCGANAAQAPPYADPLQGDPGDLLRGPPLPGSGPRIDLLRGGNRPRVEVQIPGASPPFPAPPP